MWSLPHTESKPTRSASSAVGRMSDGRANGTGYIMPSIHVGMWTPNLIDPSSPFSIFLARSAARSIQLRWIPRLDEVDLARGRPGPDEHGGVDLAVGRDLVRPRRAADVAD